MNAPLKLALMKTKISLVGTFTIDSIRDPIELVFDSIGRDIAVHIEPYGQIFQTLLNPNSSFYSTSQSLNFCFVRLQDLIDSSEFAADDGQINKQLQFDLFQAFDEYEKQTKTPLVVIFTEGDTSDINGATSVLVHQMKSVQARWPSIYVFDYNYIQVLYPVVHSIDAESNRFGHIPYSREGYFALGLFVCRCTYTLTEPEKKVIVLDCDNTLWAGVCGEDGPLGITVPEPYVFLQNFMINQLRQGMLLCLCSKNIEQDVLDVFNKNPNMHLSLDHITAHKINWNTKSQNIVALSSDLDLGLDSFIFLDDNPNEIAEVKSLCPQITALQLPKESSEIPPFLRSVWLFDKYKTTEADAKRAENYKSNADRNMLLNAATSYSDFLQQLKLNITVDLLSEADIDRVYQLFGRTNQFNTTTMQRSRALIASLMKTGGSQCYVVRVNDRFGDYGLVGALIVEKEPSALRITDFLLSCRVLGKGVEHTILSCMGAIALEHSIEYVVVDFKPSKRNDPAHRFLKSLPGSCSDESCYRFSARMLAELDYCQLLSCSTSNTAELGKPNGQKEFQQGKSPAVFDPAMLSRQDKTIAFMLSVGSAKQLLAKFDEAVSLRPDIQEPFVAPVDAMEQLIAHIWAHVLRLNKVGVNDRFQDLGGQSIDLVEVHRLLLEQLNLNIDIGQLFSYPTVRSLCGSLDHNNSNQRMANAKLRAARIRCGITAFNEHSAQRYSKEKRL